MWPSFDQRPARNPLEGWSQNVKSRLFAMTGRSSASIKPPGGGLLAAALTRLRAERATDGGDKRRLLERALGHYTEATARNPHSGLLHDRRASLLARLGRPEEARASYERAITLEPLRAYLHYDLGQLLRRQGELEAAYREYRRAIELRGDYLRQVLDELSRSDYTRKILPGKS